MTDFRIKQNFNFADPLWDLVLRDSGLIDEREELATAVRVALGTDALANANDILPDPDSTNRRGWWGNMDAESIWDGWEIGTKNWLLTRAKITEAPSEEGATLQRAEQYTIDALQPFIARGIASQVEVHATRTELNRIDVRAIIYRGPLPEIDLRFQLLWVEPDVIDAVRPPLGLALSLSVGSPVIDIPLFTLREYLARSLSIQSPVLVRPLLGGKNLKPAAFSIAAPVLAAVTVQVLRVLTAASKTVSAPVLAYSTISLGPTLFASGLTIGSPQLGFGQTSYRLLVAAPLTVNSPMLGPALEQSSAGVFDSTGKLVRTLWSAEEDYPYVASPATAWDGTLDDGSVAPTGNYAIKVLTHRVAYVWEGVIGNSSPNHSYGNVTYHNPASTIWGMAITDGGEIYYSTAYSERFPTWHYTTEANPQVTNYLYRNLQWSQHEVCTDGTIAYFAWQGQDGNKSWIVGFNCSTKAVVHFGYAINISDDLWALEYQSSGGVGYITGLAVQKSANYLFAARGAADIIHSYNKTTGQLLQTYTGLDNVGALATNPTNSELWVAYTASGATRNAVRKLTCDTNGLLTSTGVTITGLQDVMALAVSPDGATLLVADGGISQQVKAFNTSNGTVKTAWATSGVLGTANGYVNSPAVTNTKFMFSPNLHGMGAGGTYIAFSSNGSFWLGDPGNNRNLHFSSGNSPTVLEKIEFIPAVYSCDVCRGDPTRVFSAYLEFGLNYSLPLAPGNGSWTLTNNWAGGLTTRDNYDSLAYVAKLSNGRTYAVFNPGDGYHVGELSSTGLRDTGRRLYSWAYLDKDFGMYVSAISSGQVSHIYRNPFTTFDGSDNPNWQYSTTPVDPATEWDIWLTTESLPSSFPNQTTPGDATQLTANNILPVHNQESYSYPSAATNHLGGIDKATGQIKFSTYPPVKNFDGGAGATTAPYGGPGLMYQYFPRAPFFAIAGGMGSNGGGAMEYVAGKTDIFTGFRGENWAGLQTNVWTHWHDSGLCVSRWGPVMPVFTVFKLAYPNVNMQTGVGSPPGIDTVFKGMPGAAGNTRWGGLSFVNNKYYLFQSDEWFHSGVHRWRIENVDSIHLTSTNVAWNSASYVAPTLDPNELLAGLPSYTVGVPNNSGGWTRSPISDIGPDHYTRPYLAIHTNVTEPDWRRTPDLMMHAATPPGYAADWWIGRNLPRVDSQSNWRIDGEILFTPAVFPSPSGAGWRNSDTSHQFMVVEVLDATNKVIVQIGHYADVGYLPTVRANHVALLYPPLPGYAWPYYYNDFQTFIFAADLQTNKVTVTWGKYSIQVDPFAGASIGAPTKFRIHYSDTSTSQTMDYGLALRDLFYSETGAPPVPQELRPTRMFTIRPDARGVIVR